MTKTLVHVPRYAPPFWQERAWDHSNLPFNERWVLELARHGQVDKLAAELEKNNLQEPSLPFVVWRSKRGMFDHDILARLIP